MKLPRQKYEGDQKYLLWLLQSVRYLAAGYVDFMFMKGDVVVCVAS